VTLLLDGERKLAVYFPTFSGSDLTLYVAADGSTYYDVRLTSLAGSAQ
jgi:hypothetical protein